MNPFSPPHYKAPDSPRKLPQGLLSDINQFKIEGFANKFFTEHRKGLFRQRVPIEKMLVYTKVLPK